MSSKNCKMALKYPKNAKKYKISNLICPRHVYRLLPVVVRGQPPVQGRREAALVLEVWRRQLVLVRLKLVMLVKLNDGGG